MKQYTWTLALLVLVALCNVSESRTLTKRQIKGGVLEPEHHEEHVDESWRDKRKIEEKWGIKNALLGFVFNKINSWIDKKTHWVDALDHTNIAKNKAYGIEPPKDPKLTLTHIITEKVGQKLQQAGPFIGLVVQKLTSGSGGLLGGASGGSHGAATATHETGHATATGGGSGGFDFGSILGSLSGGGGGFGGGGSIHASAGGSYGR